MTFDLTQFLKTLPDTSGCYLMYNSQDQVIYVGKAKNLKRRVSSYFQREQDHPKTRAMVAQIARIELMLTRTETEAFILEYTLIKKHNPRYNIIFRDDKSYPYLYVSTQHAYPGLYFYRGARKKEGRLFGPFPSPPAVYETLHELQKIFPVRQCSDSFFRNRARPCLQYQIKRCTAPCVGLISPEDYALDVKDTLDFLEGKSQQVIQQKEQAMFSASDALDFERAAALRDQIQRLTSIQAKQYVSASSEEDVDVMVVLPEASTNRVLVYLMMIRAGNVWGHSTHYPKHAEDHALDLVLSAFILQYYTGREIPRRLLSNIACDDPEGISAWLADQAGRKTHLSQPQRGQGKQWIDLALTNAQHELTLARLADQQDQQLLLQLQQTFGLSRLPKRIECFDISHLHGTDTIASQVVFIDARASNKDYRRFNITGITAGDDPAAIYQAVKRRLLRGQQEGNLPDLLIVDGGRTQLKQAEAVRTELGLETQVMLLSIAKGEGRKAGLETYYQHSADEVGKQLSADDPLAHLLQRIRDEAHRFALSGQKAKRKTRQLGSSLEDIAGVGTKTRQKLLRAFGSLAEIKRASIAELVEKGKISQKIAERIVASYQPTDLTNAQPSATN